VISVAGVVSLLHYPIKGCAGTSVRESVLTAAGLAHDRSFMVVDPEGVYRTQRGDPRLALVRPEIGDDGDLLTLRAPGMDALSVEVDREGPRGSVDLFGVHYTGIDQGDPAAEWLTAVLGVPSRLVRVPPEHDRVTGGETPGTAGYADSSAVLVTSLPSLDLLHARLVEQGGEPVPMSRFRPNIVVGGWAEPHVEDRARQVAIGDVVLGYAKLAIRCAVTTVDQETGERAGPEPLRTLAGYRRASAGGVAFGARFAVVRPGKLSVGDQVLVGLWGGSDL
jgi:uncharacterized protein YcbX